MTGTLRWLVAAALLPFLLVGSASAVDLGDGMIRLRGATWDRERGPAEAVPAERESALAPDVVAAWVVAVAGPAGEDVRRALEAGGVRVVGYVPSEAYLVRASRAQVAALRGSPLVVRADLYRPSWKISPDVGRVEHRDPARRALAPDLLLDVIVFAGEDPARVADGVRAAGAQVLSIHGASGGNRLVAVASPAVLAALAALPEVEWIEEAGEPALRNDNVRWVIQSNIPSETPLHDHGLYGEGEIIGHIDGLITMTSCYFADPVDNTPGPNHRKVVAFRSGGSTYGQGHGTHTAGTAAGDPEPVNGTIAWRGMAPKARLSYTNVNDITGLNDSPSNLLENLGYAHGDGARVHTNSWGENSLGTYTTWSVDVDTFSRNNEDDLVVFAVLNGGASVISPENSKNCLAVAATRAAPLQDQHGSGAPGPTFDGRRKPEVMAPGISTRSASTAPCDVAYLSGTSMAAPAVAGGAALVREYLRRGFYPWGSPQASQGVDPTGALVKAVVVNSTVDLTSVPQYPSALEGWGRILLDDALYFAGDSRRLWLRDVRHAQGLSTGETDEYVLRVVDSLEPLAVTMTFMDWPAAHAAALAPVNDLDLEVEGPDGLFLGNVFDVNVGESIPGGAADVLNNVERVIVSAPTPGLWRIRVSGSSVPMGPQGYAVVANGGLGREARSAEAPDPRTPGRSLPDRIVPDDYRLDPMEPSPFRDGTTVHLALPGRSAVRLTIHDVTGRRVRVLLDREMGPGEYGIPWDGRDDAGRRVAAGIYFARLTAPGVDRTVRGVLLR